LIWKRPPILPRIADDPHERPATTARRDLDGATARPAALYSTQ
jgi:hypothetical protein